MFSTEAENGILEGFRVIRPRSTFELRVWSMSRFGTETPAFDCLRSAVAKNVILKPFRVIMPIWTFRVEFGQ